MPGQVRGDRGSVFEAVLAAPVVVEPVPSRRPALDCAGFQWSDPAASVFTEERRKHADDLARRSHSWQGLGGAYHARLKEVYRFLVPPGRRVLELGCGRGDLLASVRPSAGVGVDLSSEMVACATARHPDLCFVRGDVHGLESDQTFDIVILSDLINELWDVQRVFERVRSVCHSRTRIIINTYSRLWDWPLRIVRGLGLARPMLDQNWLTVADTRNLLALAGLEPLRSWREILLPLHVPVLSALSNRVMVRLWPFNHLALTNFIVARPSPAAAAPAAPGNRTRAPRVSVVVPARNEAGNIAAIFTRTPPLGSATEFVFVEGHSSDDTNAEIKRQIEAHPKHECMLLKQTGKGKGNAVREGFAHARGDLLIILDADLTVPPEDLPRFVEALESGKAEFANGVRLVYPMQRHAMRLLNLCGNKFFGAAFSWLLGSPVKDTLCGTKALYAADYRAIAEGRAEFGDFDPFGDFDLLFGAARLSLRIVDLPVRYRERTYGATNIHRFRHGWLLLRMVAFGAIRLKFR